jgi:hypothetical protein
MIFKATFVISLRSFGGDYYDHFMSTQHKNHLKMRIIFTFCMVLVGFASLAQTSEVKNSQNTEQDEARMAELREKWNNALGTFQIQIVNSRVMPMVDISIIEKIESSRKLDEVVYIPIMENVRIMVLPLNLIRASNFVSLELFTYISE